MITQGAKNEPNNEKELCFEIMKGLMEDYQNTINEEVETLLTLEELGSLSLPLFS
jgi:hypothetical protein